MTTWTRWLVIGAVVATSACTGGDDEAPAEKFVGTWVYAAGAQVTITCTGESPVVSDLTGNLTISAGNDADLVSVNDDCTLTYDVDGDTATIRAGQTCTTRDASGSLVATYASRTLVTSDGESLVASTTAAAVFTPTGGAPVDCNLTSTATMTRLTR